MATITQSVVSEMIAHAHSIKPIESCAYLAGTGDAVSKMIPMTNAANRADFFQFDPKEQFAAVKQARAEGLQLIGVYHSHPESPARFSEADKEWANDTSIIYMILSLEQGEGNEVLNAFRVTDNEPRPEPLTVLD